MPTRKPPTPSLQPARLTHEEMTRGITRLEELIAAITAFDVSKLQKRNSVDVEALETRIRGAVEAVFGRATSQYGMFVKAADLDKGPWYAQTEWDEPRDEGADARRYVAEGKERSAALLGDAVRWLRDEIRHAAQPTPATTAEQASSNDIFIVHGHDGEAREAVARFISTIGLNPVILSEQANKGNTVIEKVEKHGGAAGFAVVLVTPDDEGRKVGDPVVRPRARQNVILELGYFMGRLGRDRVCAMATTRDMELPSDLGGVVTEPFEAANSAWKMSIARELQSAGYIIDWNKVMR